MCSALDSLTELCGALNTSMAGNDANTQKELLKMPTKPTLARRGSLPNFMIVSNMKRHGSLPDNMHSLIDARRWDSREPHNTTMASKTLVPASFDATLTSATLMHGVATIPALHGVTKAPTARLVRRSTKRAPSLVMVCLPFFATNNNVDPLVSGFGQIYLTVKYI
jgi:hypothetical protein